ncbi:hypothetical protein MASR2M78_28220 [Treponema sp.]
MKQDTKNQMTLMETKQAVQAYTTKQVAFRFRGVEMCLSLSHGLFSSADVDSGTRLLLKVLSKYWDEGFPFPQSVLDAGCGVGVIGIAIALAAQREGKGPIQLRSQDRDELARAFTTINALENGIDTDTLSAYAESLLASPADQDWDLIVSNLPAKAGTEVLRDFFIRSTQMLREQGRAAVVIVNTLADASRQWIQEAKATFLYEEVGSEHTVFIYAGEPGTGQQARPASAKQGPSWQLCPAYFRTSGLYEMEGTGYRIDAAQGLADFDQASRAVQLAAKLYTKIQKPSKDAIRVLVHEADQGHFPAWLVSQQDGEGSIASILLCARNVLALEAARHNTQEAAGSLLRPTSCHIAACVDLGFAKERLLDTWPSFDLIVSFPQAVPRVDRLQASWEGISKLLARGGLFLMAASSTEAARFDKEKNRPFMRVADLRRDGFRAIAYRAQH